MELDLEDKIELLKRQIHETLESKAVKKRGNRETTKRRYNNNLCFHNHVFGRIVVSRTFFLFLIAVAVSWNTAFAENYSSESPAGAKVYIISPKDGEVVGKTFTVRFGLVNMGVAPAGVKVPNTGHHHLLINHEGLPDMESPLVFSDNLKHFGGGQTEAEITLPPGKHTLRLLLGNYLHIPHKPPVLSEKVTVTVKD